MRVITGRFKGRRLQTVRDRSVRPATDRVKQVIFDTLATRLDLEGAAVLDLFAGSGSLGIEAISRGAEHCCFVETKADAVECIRENLRMLGIEDLADIAHGRAEQFIRDTGLTFDLIFADPPYRYPDTGILPQQVSARNLIRMGGYMLIEHTAGLGFEEADGLRLVLQKAFGTTRVSFFTYN